MTHDTNAHGRRRAGPRMSGAEGRPDAASALALGATMFLWGTAFRATEVGSRHASPVVFSTLRAIPATLMLVLVAAVTGRRLPRDRPTVIIGAVSGLLLVTLSFEGIAEGTAMTGGGNAAVLLNTAPFFMLLFARAALGERAPWLGIAGLAIGFAGVVVIVSSQLGTSASAGRTALGMTISLAAAAGTAAGLLMVKRAAGPDRHLDIVGFTVWQYIAGTIGLVPLMLIYGHIGRTDWGSGALLGSVAYVSIGSSAVASLCYYFALRRMAATRAVAWQFLAPVVAVVVEAARGHAPGAVVLAGMATAIVGVVLVSVAPGGSASIAVEGPEAERAGTAAAERAGTAAAPTA